MWRSETSELFGDLPKTCGSTARISFRICLSLTSSDVSRARAPNKSVLLSLIIETVVLSMYIHIRRL